MMAQIRFGIMAAAGLGAVIAQATAGAAGSAADSIIGGPARWFEALIQAGAAGLLLIAVMIFLRRDKERDARQTEREREQDEVQAGLFRAFKEQGEVFREHVDKNNRELIGLTREVVDVVAEVKHAVIALERVVYAKFPQVDSRVTQAVVLAEVESKQRPSRPPPSGSHDEMQIRKVEDRPKPPVPPNDTDEHETPA
jgi:hypothetical protein